MIGDDNPQDHGHTAEERAAENAYQISKAEDEARQPTRIGLQQMNSQEFQNHVEQKHRLGEKYAKTHNTYTDADIDAPDRIRDAPGGQVVLGLCKDCGAGEAELYKAPCSVAFDNWPRPAAPAAVASSEALFTPMQQAQMVERQPKKPGRRKGQRHLHPSTALDPEDAIDAKTGRPANWTEPDERELNALLDSMDRLIEMRVGTIADRVATEKFKAVADRALDAAQPEPAWIRTQLIGVLESGLNFDHIGVNGEEVIYAKPNDGDRNTWFPRVVITRHEAKVWTCGDFLQAQRTNEMSVEGLIDTLEFLLKGAYRRIANECSLDPEGPRCNQVCKDARDVVQVMMSTDPWDVAKLGESIAIATLIRNGNVINSKTGGVIKLRACMADLSIDETRAVEYLCSEYDYAYEAPIGDDKADPWFQVIIDELARQEAKGYGQQHDIKEHTPKEPGQCKYSAHALAGSAVYYLLRAHRINVPAYFKHLPNAGCPSKPFDVTGLTDTGKTSEQNLVIAGALIVAELRRIENQRSIDTTQALLNAEF